MFLESEPAPIVLLPDEVLLLLRSVVVDPEPIVPLLGVVVVLLRSVVVDGPAPIVPLLDGVVVVEELRSVVEEPEPVVPEPVVPEPVVPLPEAAGVVDDPELVPGVVVPDGEVPVVSAGGAPGEAVCAITTPIETAAAPANRLLSNLEVFIW